MELEQFIAGVLVGTAAWPAFWLLFALLATLLSAFVVNERGGWSTLCTIGLGLMIASKWQSILANPIPLILGIVAYLVLGVLWSRFKWSRFLSAKFDQISEIRDTWLKVNELTKDDLKSLDEDQLKSYKTHFQNQLGHYGACDKYASNLAEFHASVTPKASTNKGSIVLWILYWPVTAVWYIAADIVTDICKGLYNMVGGHFQNMSNEKFNQL